MRMPRSDAPQCSAMAAIERLPAPIVVKSASSIAALIAAVR
jgi:hypothetical protein